MALTAEDVQHIYDEIAARQAVPVLVGQEARRRIGDLILNDMFKDVEPRTLEFLRQADTLVGRASAFLGRGDSIAKLDLAMTSLALRACEDFRDIAVWLCEHWESLAYRPTDPVEGANGRQLMDSVVLDAERQLSLLRQMESEHGTITVPLDIFTQHTRTAVLAFRMMMGDDRTTLFGHAVLGALDHLKQYAHLLKAAEGQAKQGPMSES